MTTAQESYQHLLKDHLSPGLRDLGFRGSGGHYRLPVDGWHALLGLQKSYHSTRREIWFTINLLAVSHPAWDLCRVGTTYPSVPSPTYHWSAGWHTRIGHLLPTRGDHWWTVTAGQDLDPLAAEVLAAIRTYALPALHAHAR